MKNSSLVRFVNDTFIENHYEIFGIRFALIRSPNMITNKLLFFIGCSFIAGDWHYGKNRTSFRNPTRFWIEIKKRSRTTPKSKLSHSLKLLCKVQTRKYQIWLKIENFWVSCLGTLSWYEWKIWLNVAAF